MQRELCPEIQQERQVERPVKLKAAEHELHPDVAKLARSGTLAIHSVAFKSAFQSLHLTNAARSYDCKTLPSDVLVTRDFEHTVIPPGTSEKAPFASDSYLRPIQFVISVPESGRAKRIKQLVLISPYEANLLLPIIEKSKKVTLHLFAPRHHADFAPLDKLDLWNVGREFSASSLTQDLKLQLNLFSGTLYLDSYHEYTYLCDALGLLRDTPTVEQQVTACGFVTSPTGFWGLQRSPVPFLRTLLLKIRKEGDGLEKTQLGKVLNALPLMESDFEQRPERLREITPDVFGEFERHTQAHRSRPSVPDSVFVPE